MGFFGFINVFSSAGTSNAIQRCILHDGLRLHGAVLNYHLMAIQDPRCSPDEPEQAADQEISYGCIRATDESSIRIGYGLGHHRRWEE